MIPTLLCQCSEIIIKSDNGVQKIRSKMVVMRDDGIYAVCKSCSHEVKLPLRKSYSPQQISIGPPLILPTK